MVKLFEQLADGFVQVGQSMKLPMAESRNHPALRYENRIFHLSLVAWFSRSGWQNGHAIMRRHLLIGSVEVRFVAAGAIHAGTWVIWNDEARRALAVFEGGHVTLYPVAQVLAQSGPCKGIGAGPENGDEQGSRCDFVGSPVIEGNRVTGPVDEQLLAGAMLLAQHYILIARPALVQLTQAAVAVSVRLRFPIFLPDQLQCQVLMRL